MRAPTRRRSTGSRILVLAVLALVVTLIGVQAAGGARGPRVARLDLAQTAVGSPSMGVPPPPNQQALDVAADDAQAIAGDAYYTEARVNDAANTVDVYLARAPQSIIDQLKVAHPETYVIHNDAAHPLSQLLQLQHSLPTQAGGARIDFAYPTSSGYLKVGVEGSGVQAAQSALDSLEGAGAIEISGGAQPIDLFGYRDNEAAPYDGGDFIHHNGDNCSSGIDVHKSGDPSTTYMLTAAHCFWADGGVGTAVHQGYWNTNGNLVGSGTLLGQVSRSDNDANGQTSNDGALINTNTGYDVFKAGWNSTGITSVVGTLANHDGDLNICTSGAFDGQVCGIKISDINFQGLSCVTPSDCFNITVVKAWDPNNSSAVGAGQGDSGGPVYSYAADGLHVNARGMIEGGDANTAVTCTSTPPNTSGRICTHVVYFVGMVTIAGDLNVATTINPNG